MRIAAVILLTCAFGACSVEETPVPDLAGPSSFALGMVVRATPDSILQDGISQSIITIDATGPDGRPARNVSLRLAMEVNGVAQDFGRLSTRTIVTDNNGNALLTYTAPPRPAESTGTGTIVTIVVTPVGGDYRGERNAVADIRLVPPGVIVPPNAVVPDFTFTPEAATAFTAVTFNASPTSSDGVPCGARCAYSWNFGDGGTGTGMLTTHEFRSVGTFTVQLTATNERGQSQSVLKTVAVEAGEAPTPDFSFSPSEPAPGQMVFFNASASRAAPGRRIVSYAWDFGSGRSASGISVSKGFNEPGTYVVTLNVTDDADQVGTISKSVPVGVSEGAAQQR
jgi:PKD repeat protein